ncbi:MAG: hypothetical protein WC750_06075 [Patescibacteria group bacterium]|jgi:hypothetical protein
MNFWNSKTAKFPFNNRGEVQPPPAGTPPAGTPPPEVIPKTKEEWDKLATENPTRWIALTQPRMDQAIREGREAREKATALEQKTKNYEAELANLKKGAQPAGTPPAGTPPATIPPPGFDPNKPFSKDNMPQTDDDWDRLFLEDPKLGADLRFEKRQQEKDFQERQRTNQTEFAKSRKESAKELWDRHPDMYVPEVDGEGKAKVDAQGKPVLKIDPNTGGPILNLESEKGKLFVEVYSEDVSGFDSAKTGPRLAMLEMERRLVAKAKAAVDAGQPPAAGSAAAAPDQRGSLPAGVPPPATGKVSFATDEEKAHAEKAVQRGVYKDLAQYCALRDGKNVGISEENRTPDFGKK